MSFCLPKFAADAMLEKFKSGELNPEKLQKMSSEERRAMFEFVGVENAKKINALFESKLLLKNQQLGMINWAKQITGLKPDVKRDIMAKIDRLDRVLSEPEMDKFLADLAEQRLGFSVTMEEKAKILEAYKEIEAKKAKISPDMPNNAPERIEYATALALFKEYIGQLKLNGKPTKFDVETIGGISKSLVASADNSFWLNQGITTLFDPRTTDLWVKNFLKSFPDFVSSLRGHDPVIEAQAHIFGNKNALNGNYERMKLAIGIASEEAYPSSLPERIPVLGRVFKASQDAYNNAALRLRAETADRIIAAAERAGVDLTDKTTAEGLGAMINGNTGRGGLGVLEPAANKLNVLMFSARLLRGTFDTLTAQLFNDKVRFKADPNKPYSFKNVSFEQKRAAQTILGMAATYYGITTLIEMLNPGTTSNDPRDAHFGQVKIGNVWYGILGPYRPLVRTLATVIPTFHEGKLGFWRRDSKGRWQGFEVFPSKTPRYGAFTPMDVAEGFLEGKASPLLSTVFTHWRGSDFNNNPPTLKGDLVSLLAPISSQNYVEALGNPQIDNFTLYMLMNAAGSNASVPK